MYSYIPYHITFRGPTTVLMTLYHNPALLWSSGVSLSAVRPDGGHYFFAVGRKRAEVDVPTCRRWMYEEFDHYVVGNGNVTETQSMGFGMAW